MFVDTNSNPMIKAYRYRISAIDTCGTETPMSNYHKTIHLTINAGLNGSWNLIWDGYQGFTFGSYNIYRGIDSLNMQFITQIQSTLSSYTDLNPPTGKLYYQIEVVSPLACFPDSILTKAQTNYNTSRSNITNTNTAHNIGIDERAIAQRIKLFPNPNKGSFVLDMGKLAKCDINLKVYSILGSEIFSEVLPSEYTNQYQVILGDIPKGVYYLRIISSLKLEFNQLFIVE